MNKLRIKIDIAGRQYPLTINTEEEEAVRSAGKEINKMIQDFEERYAVSDRQDAISMVALQMGSKYNLLKHLGAGENEEMNQKIKELSQFIERELDK